MQQYTVQRGGNNGYTSNEKTENKYKKEITNSGTNNQGEISRTVGYRTSQGVIIQPTDSYDYE